MKGLARWAGGLAFLLGTVLAQAEEVFSTWEGQEADKCASIWLIKRFIAPDAEIRFYPSGEIKMEGVAFDVPDAQLRRYHNRSTFETLLAHYELKDPVLSYVGRIMHDIEINIWGSKAMAQSAEVEEAVRSLLAPPIRGDEAVERCVAYFGRLYQHLAE